MGLFSWLGLAIAIALYVTDRIGMFLTLVIIFAGILFDQSKQEKAKKQKTDVDTKEDSKQTPGKEKISITVGVISAIAVAFVLAMLLGGGTSNSSTKWNDGPGGSPWEELGVSKKEYMDVYNYYKYGEHP